MRMKKIGSKKAARKGPVPKANRMRKVLVQISTVVDGYEGEVLRQFEVNKKSLSESKIAFSICEALAKEFDVDNVETWTQ